MFRRRLGYGKFAKEDWVRLFRGVSNPVTQRLTVFSEDASIFKKIYSFFSLSGLILSLNSLKYSLTSNKQSEPKPVRFIH